uniref:Uncharacterized protein n=1 Tax=Photinus pyralis TaxID=7054 RepID=A0A1Y1LUZ2_PHOPY
MQPPETSNCEQDQDEMLFPKLVEKGEVDDLGSANCASVKYERSSSSSSISSSCSTSSTPKEVTLEDCATVYFAGYLAKKCIDKYKCNGCGQLLISQDQLNEKNQLLIVKKMYDNKLVTSVGLRSPSAVLVDIVEHSLKIISKCLRFKPERSGLGLYIYSRISKLISVQFPEFSLEVGECSAHRQYLLQLLIRTKIFKWCKWQSTQHVKETAHAKLRILKNQ